MSFFFVIFFLLLRKCLKLVPLIKLILIMKNKLKRVRKKILLNKFYNTFIGKDVILTDTLFFGEKEKIIEEKMIKNYKRLYYQDSPNYFVKLKENFSLNSIQMISNYCPRKTIYDKIKKIFIIFSK